MNALIGNVCIHGPGLFGSGSRVNLRRIICAYDSGPCGSGSRVYSERNVLCIRSGTVWLREPGLFETKCLCIRSGTVWPREPVSLPRIRNLCGPAPGATFIGNKRCHYNP